jgi:uncharacterized protein YdhG (YjbR/CyaY superfamily)
MVKNSLKFLIVSPSFNENIGGVIALHLLCHKINQMGFESYIYDINRPVKKYNSLWKEIKYKFRLRKYLKKRSNQEFCINLDWDTPELCIFNDEISNDYIVIYPEIIQNNPLSAEKFVRWFLYFQRYENYTDEIGAKTLNIFYSEHFRKGSLNISSAVELLHLNWYHPAYLKENTLIKREGICYQIRKHDSNVKVNLPKDSINIGGLSHDEIAKIFQKCEYFFSYDMYSFYSVYASLSGCHSIVVPKVGVSEVEWRPEISSRYGIAYGLENIQWASETRLNLLNEIKNKKITENQQLNAFIRLCEKVF